MIMLCADDYGLSQGVSRGILELAGARRLSGLSAMVTFERWGADGAELGWVHPATATGLHLNLTLGRPLVAAAEVAGAGIARAGIGHLDREGRLLTVGQLSRRALAGRLSAPVARAQLQAECRAQIAAFREGTGVLPDFIDGHQHVHALPGVRDALVRAVAEFTWPRPPIVRVPSNAGGPGGRAGDVPGGTAQRVKRALIAGLTRGARATFHAGGLPTNDTFAGFSSFTVGADYGAELAAALGTPEAHTGRCHLVMCHPGHVDDELLSTGDPVVARRAEELRSLFAFEGLVERIWHPARQIDGRIDWGQAITL